MGQHRRNGVQVDVEIITKDPGVDRMDYAEVIVWVEDLFGAYDFHEVFKLAYAALLDELDTQNWSSRTKIFVPTEDFALQPIEVERDSVTIRYVLVDKGPKFN